MVTGAMLDGVLILEYVTSVALSVVWDGSSTISNLRNREAFLALLSDIAYLWKVVFICRARGPFIAVAEALFWKLRTMIQSCEERLSAAKTMTLTLQIGEARHRWQDALKLLSRHVVGNTTTSSGVFSLGLRPLQDRIFLLMAYGALFRSGNASHKVRQ